MKYSKSTRESQKIINKCAREVKPKKEVKKWYKNYVRHHKVRLARDLDLIKKISSNNEKILEVGSIPPILTLALKREGYTVKGIDIDPKRFKNAIRKNNMDIKKCNIEKEKIPLEKNSVDIVLFNEVFEHLRINLNFTFSQISEVLKENGTLILSTPNMRSLEGISNFIFGGMCYVLQDSIYEEYEKIDKLGHMGHVREYTPGEIHKYLSNFEYTLVDIVYRGIIDKNVFWRYVQDKIPELKPMMVLILKKSKQ